MFLPRFAQRSGCSRALVPSAGGCNVCALRADVAQLVEQRFRKPQVTGSNPVVGSSLRLERNAKRRLPRRSETQAGRVDWTLRREALQGYGLAGHPITDCRHRKFSRARDLMSELPIAECLIFDDCTDGQLHIPRQLRL